ncbi:MAG: dipeptidase [Clostridia bacterium]|nr:dipeptidase [Clostridia bacterium]
MEYCVIDAHCDTGSEILDRNEKLYNNSRHLSIDKMSPFKSYVQFYAAWVSKEEKNPLARALDIIYKIKNEISENNDFIEEIKNSKELKSVIERKKHGAILSLEDARSLCGSISALHCFYDLGVRAITLAWNDNNEVTDGINSEEGRGLTEFGKEVVREMNRLKMIVDVSHITPKGFWDVLETTTSPVMASHSNAYSVCRHRRNLDDAQIRALIENRGMMCVNIYPTFLSGSGKADISTVISHIDHILSLGGEDILGLGSDFDGVDSLADGISDVYDYVKLFDKMSAIGYSDELIDKITHKNMINFIERIEK